MASYSVNVAKHASLSAGVKDAVNFAYSGGNLRVRNRGTAGDIYFTISGTDPVSVGDDTYFVGPGENVIIRATAPIRAVELISAGTPAYSVEVY